MSKLRLIRTARGAVIAVVLALVVAAPAAAASATPIRTVHAPNGFTIPAGQACAFDVAGQPSWGFVAQTVFPDGRVQGSVRIHGAYVNVATGASYPTADNFRYLNLTDPATGFVNVVLDGEAADNFLPGDIGPFGLVTNPNGAFYHFVGKVWFTINLNTYQVLAFGYSGTVEDICAALTANP